MNLGCKLNIVVTCMLVISVASMAKAQLASNKSLDEIYNKKVKEQLAEKNKRGKLFNINRFSEKEKNLPASGYSLRDVAKVAIKNPAIIPHNNSAQSEEDEKRLARQFFYTKTISNAGQQVSKTAIALAL